MGELIELLETYFNVTVWCNGTKLLTAVVSVSIYPPEKFKLIKKKLDNYTLIK